MIKISTSGGQVELEGAAADAFLATLPEPAPITYRISKTTPWLRMTANEATIIDGVMSQTDARLKQIYMAATYLDSSDDLWGAMHRILANQFGENRANELLAPES